MDGGIDDGAEKALFVLGWDVGTAVVEADDGSHDVVLLEVTGVRSAEVGKETLLIGTDDWSDIARAVDEALGGDALEAERQGRWDRFVGRLECGIAVLSPGERLVIDSGLGRFVGIEVDEGFIRMETVIARYLPPHLLPGPDEVDPLEELGWNRPDEDGAFANHWLGLETDTPPSVLANIVVTTVRQVHGVVEAEELTYEASHRDGRRIVIPTLGLSRAVR